jgi:DNA-binding NtrC family response regulator
MTSQKANILIVDDEANICRSCEKILDKINCRVSSVYNGYDALKLMESEDFDVVVTDLKMSRLGGMEVVKRVTEHYPETMVIVITGYSTVASAVEVMKMGAFDYLPKPFTPHELRSVVFQALSEREIRIQNRKLLETRGLPKTITHQLVGESSQIRKVVKMVEKVAPTDSTVLVHGESGTGKELIARAIHANSRRSDRVFFAVDCGTLSGNLLESELFGHVKGAFTDAHRKKEGLFKKAHRGTVFLDEISNISLDAQGKLLRFLETRELLPIGDTRVQKVDVRLIFATNQDLKAMVAKGRFREDFYYRIYVYPIILPPLRERKNDILPIAYHFLELFASQMGKTIAGFTDEAIVQLCDHPWPGNVRQLRNVIERAVILAEQDQITPRELPNLGEGNAIEELIEHVPINNEELKRIKKEIRRKAVEKVERSFVLNALSRHQWNITQTAKAVGLQRTNFQALMKKHAIRPPRKKE